jgi:carbamoyltransferase
MPTYYIGLANTFHDSALAIVSPEGEVLFAEATERPLQFKRALHCIPDNIGVGKTLKKYCGANPDFVVATSWSRRYLSYLERLARRGFFENAVFDCPELQEFSRLLFPKAAMYAMMSMQYHYMKKVGTGLRLEIGATFGRTAIQFRSYDHHTTHAAYSAFASPFDEAACLIIDGFGEGASTSVYRYAEGGLKPVRLRRESASLGLFYEFITILCGFDWFKGEEWKVMGLAAYGKPDAEKYQLVKALVRYDRGRLQFAPENVLRSALLQLTAMKRPPDASPFESADLALAGQTVYSEVALDVLRDVERMNLSENLVLGGGCALNSSFNGQIVGKTSFKRLYVPSAPADDGNAVGAAMLAFRDGGGKLNKKNPDHFQTPFSGSSIDTGTLRRMERLGRISKLRHRPLTFIDETAARLAEGKLVAWIQGRAEFGPRALGNRSILADPRGRDMKERINARVKFREEYRPFAPSILHEHGDEYFEHYQETPYMERTLYWRTGVIDKVPAVVHEDRTGRAQTVKEEWNPIFYRLIKAFYQLTGVPILLNTSLNIMGKPIVHSIEDVLSLFYTTGLDVLVIHDYVIEK